MPAPLTPPPLHPLDAACNNSWMRFAVALLAAGVSDDDAKKISDAALDYTLARIKARESLKPWQPGDRRCEACDNGLDRDWDFCPFCGWHDPDKEAAP